MELPVLGISGFRLERTEHRISGAGNLRCRPGEGLLVVALDKKVWPEFQIQNLEKEAESWDSVRNGCNASRCHHHLWTGLHPNKV